MTYRRSRGGAACPGAGLLANNEHASRSEWSLHDHDAPPATPMGASIAHLVRAWLTSIRLREKRHQFSSHFQDPVLPPVLRLFADHAHGLRTARNRFSQLKSLRIKKKSESRVVLTQKLCLGGCTIIVVRGGAGLDLQSKL